MTAAPASRGSRTAAYVVAGVLGGVLLWVLAVGLVGLPGACALVVVAWATGGVWLLKKRQDDPDWDGRLPDRR